MSVELSSVEGSGYRDLTLDNKIRGLKDPVRWRFHRVIAKYSKLTRGLKIERLANHITSFHSQIFL